MACHSVPYHVAFMLQFAVFMTKKCTFADFKWKTTKVEAETFRIVFPRVELPGGHLRSTFETLVLEFGFRGTRK